MDFVYRLKDSVVQYLSPPQKRRRTTGPGTPSNTAIQKTFLAPTSVPQDRKAQVAALSRINKKYLAPSDTKNSRKRTRHEYEDEGDGEVISPDDSISQITPQGDDSEEISDEGSQEDSDGDLELEAEEEGSEAIEDSNAVTDEDGEVEDDEDEEMEVEENEEGEYEKYEEMEVEGDAEIEYGEDDEIEGEEDEVVEVGEEEEEEVEIENGEDERIEEEEDVEVEVGDDEEIDGDEDEEIEEEEEIEDCDEEIEAEEEEDEIEDDEIDQEASAEAKVQEYLARQAELALRREEVEKARAAGDWHPDEIFLFERLSLRSFEELIPAEWQVDFPTLPEILFTNDLENAFVKNNYRPNGSGVKALQRLLVLGVRVRDRVLMCGGPGKLIPKEVQNYIKWSEMDGDFRKMRFIPVLAVVSARRKQTTDSLSTAITNQLMFLAQRHREHLAILPEGQIDENGQVQKYRRQPPLLYGIIVAQTMAIFVTLDSANPEASVRHMTHFDFKDKNMDVWNGFAVAFIVTMSKNYIMSIKDELEVDDTPDTDEDA